MHLVGDSTAKSDFYFVLARSDLIVDDRELVVISEREISWLIVDSGSGDCEIFAVERDIFGAILYTSLDSDATGKGALGAVDGER